jgi:signal transduction histidine kinase
LSGFRAFAADAASPPATPEPDVGEGPHRLGGRGQFVVLSVAVAGAVFAVWATLDADFLKYPGWLAVQKADLVLGPVLVGLYWCRVRPASRFGWLLIAYGLINIGYVAQSFTNPGLFGVGLVWESLIYLGAQVLILTFPTGRLEGLAVKVLVAASAVNAAFNVWLIAMLPNTGAGGSISRCRAACPDNGLAFVPNTGRALGLLHTFEITVIVVAAATVLLLLRRFAQGTRPQRRALAIGTPFALVFLVCEIAYLWLTRLQLATPRVRTDLQWAFVGARSAVWYGFLLALIAAQLFAARVLRTVVARSMQRPSKNELEAMLRGPLGDPSFHLRFWDAGASRWDGAVELRPGSAVTFVERDGGPAVALIHDAQLTDDPELVQTAGAIAVLAAENAELDERSRAAVDDLQRSRARIVQAIDNERRRVANDLHDGVQQRLGGIRLRLSGAALKTTDEATRADLVTVGNTMDETIEDVRRIAHELYPRLVLEEGLVSAVRRAVDPIHLEHGEIGAHSPELDSAIYYSVLEAVRNAHKHGGGNVTATLREEDGVVTFTVSDDGPGFDPSVTTGMGLQSLHDRLAAFGGDVSIVSAPGRTTVSARVPVNPE